MLTLVKPTKKDTTEAFGDLLFGTEFIDLNEELPVEMYGIPVRYFDSFDVYLGLKNILNIDTDELKKVSTYSCPVTGNKHYWVLPVGISSLTDAEFKKCDMFIPEEEYIYDFHADMESYCDDKHVHVQMGLGYTAGTLPSDGDVDTQLGTIKLSDGRVLYVIYYMWFNK